MVNLTYTIQPGDNFYTIAQKLFGSQRFAGLLLDANPDINALHPGMEIVVPDIHDTSETVYFSKKAQAHSQNIDQAFKAWDTSAPQDIIENKPWEKILELDTFLADPIQEIEDQIDQILDLPLLNTSGGLGVDDLFNKTTDQIINDLWDDPSEFDILSNKLGLDEFNTQLLPNRPDFDLHKFSGLSAPPTQTGGPTHPQDYLDEWYADQLLQISTQSSQASLSAEETQKLYNDLLRNYANLQSMVNYDVGLPALTKAIDGLELRMIHPDYIDYEFQEEPPTESIDTPTPEPTQTPTPDPTQVSKDLLWSDFNKMYPTDHFDSLEMRDEYFELYSNGLGENEVYFPNELLVQSEGFGQGYEPWEEYYASNDKDPSAAQYIAPGEVVPNKGLMRSSHFNLCGQLVVIASLGLDIEEGLRIFANVDILPYDVKYNYPEYYNSEKEEAEFSKGSFILNTSTMTTSVTTLMQFFRAAVGAENIKALFHKNHKDENGNEIVIGLNDIESNLAEGDILIALVNIDGNKDGQLSKISDKGENIAHWVWVQDVIIDNKGYSMVRVYNPYMNREEIYPWSIFSESWQGTTNPNSSNLFIEISFSNQ